MTEKWPEFGLGNLNTANILVGILWMLVIILAPEFNPVKFVMIVIIGWICGISLAQRAIVFGKNPQWAFFIGFGFSWPGWIIYMLVKHTYGPHPAWAED